MFCFVLRDDYFTVFVLRSILVFNGLVLAGLQPTSTHVVTYVRQETRELWDQLNGLGAACVYRGVWICGPPGVGKSTELFGWGMFQATREDAPLDLVWVHQQVPGRCVIVKVTNRVVSKGVITWEGDNFPTQAVLDVCEGCQLLLFDALRGPMTALVGGAYLRYETSIIVACTSYQSKDWNTEETSYIRNFNFNYTVYSWTLDQYRRARDHGIFADISEEQFLVNHEVAGGCLRLMLKGEENARTDLDTKLSAVENCSSLLAGLGGVKSVAAVNTLLSVYPGQHVGLVSKYVMRQLAKRVDASFTASARNDNSGNPSWQEWVFEMELTRRLRMSASIPFEYFDESGQSHVLAINQVQDYNGLAINLTTSGTIIYPTKWNQGCFDFVYYCEIEEKRVFLFLKATLAVTHHFNFKFVAEFMHLAVGTPEIRAPHHENIVVKMAVIKPSRDLHTNFTARTESIETIQCYDPLFEGIVGKLGVNY